MDETTQTRSNWLAGFLSQFADGHLYIGTALLLTTVATALLVLHYIGEPSWVSLIEWVWASVVGGGALAAYRK